jgi:hypothetical protein
MNVRVSVHRLSRVESIYRVGIWLPLVVPAILALVTRGAGVFVPGDSALGKVAQVLLSSLLYGGVPYAILAVWATWWIGGRPESAIRRLMFRAPLFMAAFFFIVAAAVGVIVGEPRSFLALGVLGAIVAIPLGYFYVFCVVLMREELGPGTGSA